MSTRWRAPLLGLAVIVAASLAAPVRGGDTEDLHAAVRKWREGSEPTGGTLVGWTVGKARAAVQGVGRGRKGPDGWSDPEVLAGSLFLTARAQRELATGGAFSLWFDLARQMLEWVNDPARRRALQRDWALAVAALHNSRFDGLNARSVLDRGVEVQPDDPELLFADARLHEAIGARGFTGVAEPVPAASHDAVAQELMTALLHYQKLVELAPDRKEARLRCGRVLSLLRRGGGARQMLDPLRQSPGGAVSCLALVFLGVVAEQEGHPAQALACYRGALATGHAPQTARLAIARLLRGAGDAAKARATVEEMLADRAAGEDAWESYQAEGFGDTADHAARFAALWKEARQ